MDTKLRYVQIVLLIYVYYQNQGRSLLKKLGDSSISWLGLADKEVLIMQEIVLVQPVITFISDRLEYHWAEVVCGFEYGLQ